MAGSPLVGPCGVAAILLFGDNLADSLAVAPEFGEFKTTGIRI